MIINYKYNIQMIRVMIIPIDVTLVGIVTDVNNEHDANALEPCNSSYVI